MKTTPLFVPPLARATAELLRQRGHYVAAWPQRTGSLRYTIDAGRKLTALQMTRFYTRRYEKRAAMIDGMPAGWLKRAAY